MREKEVTTALVSGQEEVRKHARQLEEANLEYRRQVQRLSVSLPLSILRLTHTHHHGRPRDDPMLRTVKKTFLLTHYKYCVGPEEGINLPNI